MKKQLVSWVMVLALCLTLFPMTAQAAERGSCGSHVAWVLDDSGTLTISGAGEMNDFSSSPWSQYGIRSVVIQDGITKIGNYAFRGCTGLTSVSIPNSVTNIGYCTFQECTGLTSISFPDSVTEIGNWDFYGCTSLTSVNIPNSVTKIGYDAFEDCISLTNVNIPDSVTEISGGAFSGCTSLTNVNIPNSVTEIGGSAFSGCTSLTSVNIPNSITGISDRVFSGCVSLTSVKIPSSVKKISYNAFANCTGLEILDIQCNIEDIDSTIFPGCTALKTIYIPVSVTSISAFGDCNNLTDIYYGGNESQWLNVTIGSSSGNLLFATMHYNSTGLPVITKSGFADVPDSSPFSNAVAWAVSKKITTGVTATSFEPSTTCTHNHILTFLWRSQGSPASIGDNDFTRAINWAQSRGIADSVNGSADCTRAEAVTYLWKLAGSPSVSNSVSFPDVPASANYAAAVAWAVANNITTGYSDGTFGPDNTCTRGQIVTFLYRAIK